MLPKTIYNLSGKELIIFMENHTEEEVEICPRQRLGTIHSLDIDKEAWFRKELRGSNEPKVEEDDEETLSKNVNSMQESDYPTEKVRFIC